MRRYGLIGMLMTVYAFCFSQNGTIPRSWYVDRFTGQIVQFPIPFTLDQIQVVRGEQSTRFDLSISPYDYALLSDDSVYILEIHTKSLVIVYTHNFNDVPGVMDDNRVSVIRRRGATRIAEGTIQLDTTNSKITVIVPIILPDELVAVVFRYLPNVSHLERVSGGRPPRVDHLILSADPFIRIPGWPRGGSQQLTQQQRRLSQSGGQSRQPGGQQRRQGRGGGSSGGGTAEEWTGGHMDVPVPEDGSIPWNDPRFRGGDGKPWPRDISVPDSPEEPGVKLPGDVIVNWGFEHGPNPWPGPDGSDAWVGIVGHDDNENGRLDPGEVEGVIGLCPPDGSVNNFYVDDQGFVHWENRKKGNEDAERPDLHYIYDPRTNTLKIYDKERGLIYTGPPENWDNHVR